MHKESLSKTQVLPFHLSVCQHIIISGIVHNVACRLVMKAISKEFLVFWLVHLDADSTDQWAQQNFKIPEHANNRTLPSWLFVARSLERDLPLVAPMPFWALSYPLYPKCLPLLICARCHDQDQIESYEDERRTRALNGSKMEIHLIEVKYCEDNRPGHLVEAFSKRLEILCKHSKLKLWVKGYPSHHPSWCGIFYLYFSNFTSSQRDCLDKQKSPLLIVNSINLLSNHMLTLRIMRTIWLQLEQYP